MNMYNIYNIIKEELTEKVDDKIEELWEEKVEKITKDMIRSNIFEKISANKYKVSDYLANSIEAYGGTIHRTKFYTDKICIWEREKDDYPIYQDKLLQRIFIYGQIEYAKEIFKNLKSKRFLKFSKKTYREYIKKIDDKIEGLGERKVDNITKKFIKKHISIYKLASDIVEDVKYSPCNISLKPIIIDNPLLKIRTLLNRNKVKEWYYVSNWLINEIEKHYPNRQVSLYPYPIWGRTDSYPYLVQNTFLQRAAITEKFFSKLSDNTGYSHFTEEDENDTEEYYDWMYFSYAKER